MNFRFPFKITARQESALTKLLKSETVTKVLEAEEQSRLEERRGLVARYVEVQHAAATETPAAGRELNAAIAALEKAQAALKTAKAREMDARNNAYRATRAKDLGILESEIRAAADPRLAEFVYYCESIEDHDLVVAYTTWMTSSGWGKGGAVLHTNVDDLQAGRQACKLAKVQCLALQMRALSYAEVTTALSELCMDLAGPLSRAYINPPQIAMDGEVGPPLPWTGESEWVVEEVNQRLLDNKGKPRGYLPHEAPKPAAVGA